VALVLGLAAVLVLCVPLLGYASFVLGGLGLLLGLWGLFRSPGRDSGVPKGRAGGPAAVSAGRALAYPLAGALVAWPPCSWPCYPSYSSRTELRSRRRVSSWEGSAEGA
jgi:hypothetical protein